MDEIWCYAFAEDAPSCAVIHRLLAHRNASSDGSRQIRLRPGFPVNKHGSGAIKKMIPGFLQMAANDLCVLVLTDLDAIPCVPELFRQWNLPFGSNPTPERLWLRIAVREIESWLLADIPALSAFLKIAESNLTTQPDELADPKQFLLNLIRRKCRSRLYQQMLPRGNANIGTDYNPMLVKFIEQHWDPARAMHHSPSLHSAVHAMLRIR